jgi:methylthioribose-1-phosphate isomerase
LHTDTIRAITWHDDHVRILDQTILPDHEHYLECRDLETIALAIERLSVRGAPAIGVAAAMALALESQNIETADSNSFLSSFEVMVKRLRRTRPTAVNLQWALQRMTETVHRHMTDTIQTLKAILKQEALDIYSEDIKNNKNIGKYGLEIVPDNATILTICNTGSLATAGYGTALGVIRSAVQQGRNITVVACETRPLLQGARLTAWELQKDGIPFTLITDSMAGYYMTAKGVDLVIAGADRVAANGDTANKIGTYTLAILAKEHRIPFYIAAPISTIDQNIQSGNEIIIEERSSEEITCIKNNYITPLHIRVWNPSFDVVPHKYITGIITDKGILKSPYKKNISAACKRN